jgi:hypothetical protein
LIYSGTPKSSNPYGDLSQSRGIKLLSDEMITQDCPITLKRMREPFDHPDWVFELKHDSFRAIADISNTRCQLVSRQDNVYQHFKPCVTLSASCM